MNSNHGEPLGIVFKALAFSAEKHRNLRRKDAEASPYINHPIALANVLINEAGIADPIVICGALLHDTVEDTETSFEELESQFGLAIAQVVREVTDDKLLPKEVRKQLQVEHAAHASHHARLVKLADKICNLRDIAQSPPKDWSLERKVEYFRWAKQVVDALGRTHDGLEEIFNGAYAAVHKMGNPVTNPLYIRENPDIYDEMDCRP